MEIKIAKIQLGITSNGTPKCLVWGENTDLNSLSDAIEIIGKEVIYLATRKIGETVEFTQKGRWMNIVVPPEYAQALQTPAYARMVSLFNVAMHGIDVATNGIRTAIDIDTANVLLTDDLNIFLKMQDITLKTIKEIKTDYTNEIVRNLKLPLSEQTLNPYNEINRLTLQSINNITKEYRIINNGEDVKEKKK